MKGGGTARLFIALWPDESTQRALAGCGDAWIWDAGAALVGTKRLHLTLHFLGAVPQPRLPELIEGMQVPFHQFSLCLDRAERWSNGIAALTPTVAPKALLALHAALRDRLEQMDLPTERRRLRPHLTLARRAGRSTAPIQISPVSWHVKGYVLVESLAATGEYVALRHYADTPTE